MARQVGGKDPCWIPAAEPNGRSGWIRSGRIAESIARCAVLIGLASAAPSLAQIPVPVPELVADINTQSASEMVDVEFFPGSLPDGRVLFSATTMDEGKEVWVTDGTVAGTHMVDGFFPGPEGVEPDNPALADGEYYFHSRSRDDALWRSDGNTVSSVVPVNGTLVPVWDGSQLLGLAGPSVGVNRNDRVFVLDDDQLTEFPIAPGQIDRSANPVAGPAGGMLFWADGEVQTIFSSDGSSVGTHPLIDTALRPSNAFEVFGGNVAISSPDIGGDPSQRIGVFDAITGDPSPANSDDPPLSPLGLVAHGDDGVFYSGSTSSIGRELCYYDAALQSHACFDLNATGSAFHDDFLVAFEDGVCFAATDGQTGIEPWCYSLSDGFQSLGDLAPGPDDSDPGHFVVDGDVLFFTVEEGASAGTIYRFDSGSAQAVPYLDLDAASTADAAKPLRVVDGTLLFEGAPQALWDRDARASNFRLSLNLVPPRRFLGFSASSGSYGELIVEDTSSTPLYITPFQDGVAMVAFRPSEGFELTAVESDGTLRREEICPGTEGVANGHPIYYRLGVVGDRLFLTHDGQCSSISEELILWDGALAQQVPIDLSSPSSPVFQGRAGNNLIVTKNESPPLYAIDATTGLSEVLSETVGLWWPQETTETSHWAVFGSAPEGKTYATDGSQLLEIIDESTDFGALLEQGSEPDDFTLVRFGSTSVYTVEGPLDQAEEQDGPVLSDIPTLPVGQLVNGFVLFVAKDGNGSDGFYKTAGSEWERIADGGGRIAGNNRNGWFYTTVSGGFGYRTTFTELWFIDEFGNQSMLRTFLDFSARETSAFNLFNLGSGGVGNAVSVGDWLVFSAVTTEGHQLWMSDGTPESTFAVPGVLQPTELTVQGNDVYFSAFGLNGEGAELWRIRVPEQPLFSDRFEP